MTRLNKDTKDLIVKKAIEQAGIPAQEDELKKRRAKWAEDCRVYALGGKEEAAKLQRMQKRIEKILVDVPEGMVSTTKALRHDYDIVLNIGGLYVRTYFHGGSSYGSSGDLVYKLTPDECTITGDHPLAIEFHKIEAVEKAIKEEHRTISANVRAALDKARTIKRLLELWPEAKDLLPEKTEPVALPPAIRREELNAMIGLPA